MNTFRGVTAAVIGAAACWVGLAGCQTYSQQLVTNGYAEPAIMRLTLSDGSIREAHLAVGDRVLADKPEARVTAVEVETKSGVKRRFEESALEGARAKADSRSTWLVVGPEGVSYERPSFTQSEANRRATVEQAMPSPSPGSARQ